MEIFKTHKTSLVLFLLLSLSPSLCSALAQSPVGLLTQSNENIPQPASTPFPYTNIMEQPQRQPQPAFAKSLNNQNQQPRMGNQQQQQQLNYPQQGPTQPFSGFTQPFSSINQQPLSGFNQPFSSSSSSFNQPFGASNQQGIFENNNTPFENGVSKQGTCFLGLVLSSLLALILSFGYFV